MTKKGEELEAKRQYITWLRVEKQMSIAAIAAKLPCSFTTVRNKLISWGVREETPAIPPDRAERNAKIIELVDKGIPDINVAAQLGVSRGVVIGIRNRNGRNLTADEIRHKNRQNGKRTGNLVNARRQPKHKTPPIAPLAELEKLVQDTPRPARPGVPIEQLTGCRWPFGDIRDNPPMTYCNEPCCEVVVRGGGGKPIRVRYCAEHWDKRRASNHTKVVA